MDCPKDKMNYIKMRAEKRHVISPRKTSVSAEPINRDAAFFPVISTIELRRLVAAMVD